MSVLRTNGPLVPQTHAKMNLGDQFREALLGVPGACSPVKLLESWYCLVASDANIWYFSEQIELSNPEYFRA